MGITHILACCLVVLAIAAFAWRRAAHKAAFLRLRRFAINVLAQGEIPRHVAFIMDGNRRYAKRRHVATLQGHSEGFRALELILEWCMDLGIKEVSVYAFSIENFKRPKEEVDGLMELAKDKFEDMMQENKMIDKLGIRVKVQGDISLIPEKTRASIEKVVEYSKDNRKATLNVCMAYTARDEMARAVASVASVAERARDLARSTLTPQEWFDADAQRIARMVKLGEGAVVGTPEPETKEDKEEKEREEEMGTRWGETKGNGREVEWGWEDEVWNAMMIKNAPELIIRTSGEVRFSDYMLWQTAFSCVVFLNVLWPDFSLWHFLYVILVYQSKHSTMEARRKLYSDNIKNCKYSPVKST